MSTVIFALDIGTRSVVGTILQEIDGKHEVLDLISIEHDQRAMIDGQIHNISDVAQVIKNIKTELEEKHGPLKEVSVAAAGRALITRESTLTIDLEQNTISSIEDLHRFELAAVQQAQQELLLETDKNKDGLYYCVGYSVLHYTLDKQKIGDLIDQTGRVAEIHVIATFLPQVVVESLLAALQRAELEMTALTLEPIAAIHVLVPPSMRKLNIALVDIGAGTSDIAIADDNTITAYGMVPLAGDEVTDAISQSYLVDFPIAENIKRQLTTEETIEIEDILGFIQQMPVEDINEQIDGTIEKIAQSIAAEIMRLNRQQAPKAVILVGGGSLTPALSQKISEALSLPEMRVGIRGLEALNNVIVSKDLGHSPELVTPIGIAIAAQKAPLQYMSVRINKKNVRLFDLKEVTVGDALIAANFSIDQMIGRPGRGMTITFDGKTVAIPGEVGRSATLRVNGKQVTIKHKIKNQDEIEILGGVAGADAKPTLEDLTSGITSIQATLNHEPISLQPTFLINGKESYEDIEIQDRDVIDIAYDRSLQYLLSKKQYEWKDELFTLTIDKKPMRLKQWETQFYVDDMAIRPNYQLQDGDNIIIQIPELPTLEEISQALEIPFFQRIAVFFNNQPIQIEKPHYKIYINGDAASHSSTIQHGDEISLETLHNHKIVFSDVFAFTNYKLPSDVTGSYSLLRNGAPIQLNDEIFHNDRLEIKFQLENSI